MLGTLTILADGGIATGAMALGGKVWKDRDELGKVLSTGMDLRKKFAVGSLLLATPVLVYLLRYHEASWLMTILITLSLIPAFFSALSGTILQIPLKLKQDINPLQKNQVEVNIGRLGMLVLTIFVFPWAYIAILAAGLPQIWANIQLRKLSLPYVNWDQKVDKNEKKNLLVFVKRILPGAFYFCISGQITIWLISIFGSTNEVAELGALGRLSMILTIVSVMIGTLIYPRFARLKSDKSILISNYLRIQFLVLIVLSHILIFIWFFSSTILLILGDSYLGLESALILSFIGSSIHLLAGLSFGLSSSRGYVINPFISIPISIFSIIVALTFINISSLIGVLFFNITIAATQLFLNQVYSMLKFWKLKEKI